MIPTSSSSPTVLGVAGSDASQGRHAPPESGGFLRHGLHERTEEPVGGATRQAAARPRRRLHDEESHSLPDLDLAFLLEALDPPSLEDRNWLQSLAPVSTPTSELAAIDLTWPDTPSSSTPPPEDSHLLSWSSQQPAAPSGPPRQKQIISQPSASPTASSSPRVVEKRRKDYGSMTPLNLRASTKDEAMYDGYRWQKYGKKAIKNFPHPRYYYKCVSKHCNARKQVQHSPMDEGVILTTYDGTHNHEPPTSITFGVVVSATSPCFCSSSGSLPCLSCLNLARAPLHNPHPYFSHQQNALHQSNPPCEGESSASSLKQ